MREIKFRAWNGELGKFLDEGFSISMDGTSLYFEDCEEIFLSDYPEIAIEQFTGLKDKNGKEIYEGDIVKYEEGDVYIDYHTVMFGEPNNHDWGGASFYLRRISNERYSDSDVHPYIEVIGNIHENPALLQVKQ